MEVSDVLARNTYGSRHLMPRVVLMRLVEADDRPDGRSEADETVLLDNVRPVQVSLLVA